MASIWITETNVCDSGVWIESLYPLHVKTYTIDYRPVGGSVIRSVCWTNHRHENCDKPNSRQHYINFNMCDRAPSIEFATIRWIIIESELLRLLHVNGWWDIIFHDLDFFDLFFRFVEFLEDGLSSNDGINGLPRCLFNGLLDEGIICPLKHMLAEEALIDRHLLADDVLVFRDRFTWHPLNLRLQFSDRLKGLLQTLRILLIGSFEFAHLESIVDQLLCGLVYRGLLLSHLTAETFQFFLKLPNVWLKGITH